MSKAREKIRTIIENAPIVSDGRGGGRRPPPPPPAGPPDSGDGVDPEIVKRCAKLDVSDIDNAARLEAHFGRDLVVAARDGADGGDWLIWSGRHWDHAAGQAGSLLLAQKVGPRIKLELEHLAATTSELKAISDARDFRDDDDSAAAKAARASAATARAALKSRRTERQRHVIQSKNAGRVEAMRKMLAPQKRRSARQFNVDPHLLVTNTHTLRFVVERDLECPDPAVERKKARVEAVAAFDRADYATGLAPCDYDPDAKCPKFTAFLAETLPDPDLRRTVRAYSGMGLLGVLAQRLMFHHGEGANGKSVFLSVLAGVIGPSLSVGLPKETLLGQGERGAGQASPDLVRLFGKRIVRIDELKEGEKLREDLVKRLTGGDPIVVRALYDNSYLEFPNVATPHMSGNGFPQIDGTDNGIWRRILVVGWSVVIPLEKRREFDEIVADLLTERSGILNWLIAGAVDYLENGLYIAEAALEETARYRREMDPVPEFKARCLISAPGEGVPAKRMHEAYTAWARANARPLWSSSRFGKALVRTVERDDKGKFEKFRTYRDVRLSDDVLELMRADHHDPPAPDHWSL